MTCPQCGIDNRDSAERCASCGHALALPMGTVLAERYLIESLLGVGGLGRVYRAHDRMLDERVAVKILHPEAARSTELKKRFRSEIKLARKVRHKNVCAIHEYGEHEGYRFVAMELVDGVDLHRILREQGPLPPRDGFEVAIQVTKGLAAIHEAGVIHRDLKTPNIMRDRQGHVRLLDFGIAKPLIPTGTAVTAVQKVVGTPEYMSPEQIRGDDLDERSDLYGLGIVIYEIFSGTLPFQGKSPLDTLVKHMNTPPPLYGDAAARFPQALVPVLRRCLAKKLEERYGSARELLEALRAARDLSFPDSEPARTPTALGRLEEGGLPAAAGAPASPGRPSPTGSATPTNLPPTGPPRNPLPVAPPLPAAPGRPAREGLGAALALMGLLAVVGAWAWQSYPRALRRAAWAPPPGGAPVVATPAPESTAVPETTARQGLGDPTSNGSAVAGTAGPETAAPDVASPSPLRTAPSPMSSLTPAPGPGPGLTPVAPPAPSPLPARASRRMRPSPSPVPEPTPLAAPLPTVGTLLLEAKPTAEVEIDGRPLGPTPLSGLELEAGSRILTLRHPDYWPLTRRFVVEAGRRVRLDVDLSWEAVPRARSREAPFATPLDDSPSDPYFDRGLRQMSEGDFREAILTLEPVARRLEQAGKEKEQARADFYLGVALLELNRQGAAKERFEKALAQDRSLKVPASSFSPKVMSFFATVRDGARDKP